MKIIAKECPLVKVKSKRDWITIKILNKKRENKNNNDSDPEKTKDQVQRKFSPGCRKIISQKLLQLLSSR